MPPLKQVILNLEYPSLTHHTYEYLGYIEKSIHNILEQKGCRYRKDKEWFRKDTLNTSLDVIKEFLYNNKLKYKIQYKLGEIHKHMELNIQELTLRKKLIQMNKDGEVCIDRDSATKIFSDSIPNVNEMES